MINIIVAVSENNVIGSDNKLVWHLPEELQYFKKVTINKTIIMGRKTFDSIGKALPKRKNIVLTTNKNFSFPEVEVCNNFQELIDKYESSEEEIFVIGGAEIYKLFLPYVFKIYYSVIHQIVEGNIHFPEWKKDDFHIISEQKYNGFTAKVFEKIK